MADEIALQSKRRCSPQEDAISPFDKIEREECRRPDRNDFGNHQFHVDLKLKCYAKGTDHRAYVRPISGLCESGFLEYLAKHVQKTQIDQSNLR